MKIWRVFFFTYLLCLVFCVAAKFVVYCVRQASLDLRSFPYSSVIPSLLFNSILPIGMASMIMSFRMSKHSDASSDFHQTLEFLFGALGFVAFILGAVFFFY